MQSVLVLYPQVVQPPKNNKKGKKRTRKETKIEKQFTNQFYVTRTKEEFEDLELARREIEAMRKLDPFVEEECIPISQVLQELRDKKTKL